MRPGGSAPCAAQGRDSFGAVPAKNLVPRGTRIPLPPGHWWPVAALEAANRRADGLKIRRPGYRSLAADLAAVGVDADEDTVGRCLRGEIVTWELAVPLSKLLDIPAPATIASTMDDARQMESADEIRVLLDRLRAVDRKRQR